MKTVTVIEGLSDTRTLYRILPIKRLIQIYESKKLTLISPNMWEDPFEKYWLSLINPAHAVKTKNVFGLCFSSRARSDALWRIYSPEMTGVRVALKMGDLKQQLISTNTPHTGKFVIGNVEYQKKDGDLIGWANKLKTIESAELTAKNAALAWMRKRWGFEHEQESRLMYITHKKEYKDKNTISFEINPNELFSSIYVDPRLTYKKAQDLIKIIDSVVNTSGASRTPIKHSGLYTLPKALRNQ